MKILIIEDEKKIADAIKRGLEQEYFTVEIANDGLNGLQVAIDSNFDLIVLDLMLPKLSGIEICKSLRKAEITTPIIMLTAKAETIDKITGLNCGADDYLTKPFSFEELLARVKALLRRSPIALQPILKCIDLSLDLNSNKVIRDKKEIFLSKKEFMLLEYLLKNKNKIMSKEQILENVWEYDSEILFNTVEQYIGYLRTKIDKAFPKKPNLINTVRGFGYTISDNQNDK